MLFAIYFAAWFLFVIGVVNAARGAYGYAVKPKTQHSDWFEIVRATVAALCFAGWWMLIK